MMNSSSSQSTDMLTALNDAALAIAEGLSLPRTLQRIADTARALVQTKYAALGVLSEDVASYRLKQFITSGLEPEIAAHITHEPVGGGLLGNIFKEGVAINVPHIADDNRSAGFCENHPHMDSFLGVPITNRGRHIGNLYLCDRLDGQPFDHQDEEILTLLAAHAAIAIENAQLHAQLQDAALRTERDRIGMELHDGVIQSIYGVGMKLEIMKSQMKPLAEHQAQFQIIMSDLNQIIDDIRAYIRNLLTAKDEKTALNARILSLVTHFRDFSGVDAQVDVADDLPLLSDFQRHNILQIVREGLANIAHHAQAQHAEVSLKMEDRDLILIVRDDGVGFDTSADAPKDHFGLSNITNRAQRLGGSLEIDSAADAGTTLTMRVPLKLDFGQ